MHRTILSLLPAAAFLAYTPAPGIAQGINSSGQLKNACENSPGNVVNIIQPTKIEFGPALPTPENINSACTLQIGPNATFEVKQVAVNFAGALSILSANKTKVVLEDAPWSAASITVDLSALSSELISKQSRLAATGGNLSITLGPTGKFELINPFSGSPNGLQAAGSVSINAGNKFSGVIGDATVQAGSGISINLGGADSVLKLDEANLVTTVGSVSINAANSKVIVEMNQGAYSSTTGVSVVLSGQETGLKVKDGVFTGGSGSVTLQAGGAAALFGSIEVNQTSFSTASTLAITSGMRGKTLVDNVQLDGAAGVEVRSGGQGNTLVKNSRGVSTGSITLATGLAGVCINDNNNFTAPVLSLCQ